MNEEKYCQILSTIEAVDIQPDAALENNSTKNIMIQCRICLEEYGPFIVPCKCDGSMKYVHDLCLKKWACQRIKKQARKDEQKAKGKLSNIHGIECQLCKENILMEVKKRIKFVGCRRAKQNSENYFLPFTALLLLNSIIFLACLGGALTIVTLSFMLVFEQEKVEFQKFKEHPAMIWGLLGFGFVLSIVFMAKSLIELYLMFFEKEHQIIKVISKPMILSTLPKTTQPDCPNTKWFGNLEPLSTPTSPHSVNDQLLQNKLSLTRKNMTVKQKVAREIAERKLPKQKQFKKEPQSTISHQSSVSQALKKQVHVQSNTISS